MLKFRMSTFRVPSRQPRMVLNSAAHASSALSSPVSVAGLYSPPPEPSGMLNMAMCAPDATPHAASSGVILPAAAMLATAVP